MNIFLWVLQVLLAIHTAIGAAWKFSHSVEQTMPSLSAIPNGLWLAMGVVEFLCALALVAPALNKSLAVLVPVAAVFILLEMLMFSALHLFSGSRDFGSVIYWCVVATIAAFIAYGRWN